MSLPAVDTVMIGLDHRGRQKDRISRGNYKKKEKKKRHWKLKAGWGNLTGLFVSGAEIGWRPAYFRKCGQRADKMQKMTKTE
jgi:hypothetical protein